jgi:hypothetical protein
MGEDDVYGATLTSTQPTSSSKALLVKFHLTPQIDVGPHQRSGSVFSENASIAAPGLDCGTEKPPSWLLPVMGPEQGTYSTYVICKMISDSVHSKSFSGPAVDLLWAFDKLNSSKRR